MFANPAQPRLLSEPFFEKGGAVGDRSGGEGVMPALPATHSFVALSALALLE